MLKTLFQGETLIVCLFGCTKSLVRSHNFLDTHQLILLTTFFAAPGEFLLPPILFCPSAVAKSDDLMENGSYSCPNGSRESENKFKGKLGRPKTNFLSVLRRDLSIRNLHIETLSELNYVKDLAACNRLCW